MDSGESLKFLGCFETYKLNVKKIKVYFLTEPIGTRCYFADSLEDFIDFECGDLDNKIGILVDVKDNEECPFIAILDYPDMYWKLPFFFCLPCSFVQSNEPVGISDRLKKS